MRVLIADDEQIERECLHFLLERIDLKMQVDTAVDGRSAYQQLQEKEYDLLITDIRMPYIDGLELTAHAVNKNPSMQVIIISGYDEFAYAKRAVSLGVKEYILKPIDPIIFNASMLKVIAHWEESKLKKERDTEVQAELRKYILQQITSGISIKALETRFSNMISFDFLKTYNTILLLDFTTPVFDLPQRETIIDIIHDNVYDQFDHINESSNRSLIFLKDSELNKDALLRLAERVRYSLEVDAKTQVYISIRHDIKNRDLYDIYNELEEQLAERFFRPNQYIFADSSFEQIDTSQKIDISKLFESLHNDIENNDINTAYRHFKLLQKHLLGSRDFSHIFIKYNISELIKKLTMNPFKPNSHDFDTLLQTAFTSSDINQLLDLLESALLKAKEATLNTKSRKTLQAKEFIHRYYSNANLGVQSISDAIDCNADYLSRLFKAELGTNINRYLKEYRMNIAKSLLLETNLKIYEICEAVGYRNSSYFIQSFKDCFAVSPEKYRNDNMPTSSMMDLV